MRILTLGCAAALCVFISAGAFAFDAAAPDDATATPNSMKPQMTPGSEDAGARSAKSIECSQNADAENLHGKPRRHFMHECKHGA
jgi:hypothetical protein